MISNLYWNQLASVKVDEHDTEYINIQRGVRQGCILSPMLFNVYSEEIFREALHEVNAGILLNGEYINNIRYSDDTVICADSIEGLQELMNNVVDASKNYGLTLNPKKTKYMVISKLPKQNIQLKAEGQTIQRVPKYTYLGTTINDQWDHSSEIKCRIEKARGAYTKMRDVFRSHDLNLKTKMRLVRCYVYPVLLYEMWIYRRI